VYTLHKGQEHVSSRQVSARDSVKKKQLTPKVIATYKSCLLPRNARGVRKL
jgi:hypothetical protein